MKTIRWLFLFVLMACPSVSSAQQEAPQGGRKACWIVDVTITKHGEVDYVDGRRVPEGLGGGTVIFLREQERKTSPLSCMRSFITASVQIEDINNLRKIAGKIGYEEFQAYLYQEQDRKFAREILWAPQVSTQAAGKQSRILDIAITKSGEVDYVDGTRVPSDTTTIEYLQELEKTSPRSSLVVFVKASARIEDLENARKIAERMKYQEFRAYVRDSRDSSTATEVLYGPPVNLDELRMGPRGPVPWPDRPTEKK